MSKKKTPAIQDSKKDKKKNKSSVDKKNEKKISAQKTIRYKEMAKDGICRVQGKPIQRQFVFMISTISWHKTKTRMQSLKTGVIS